MAYDAQKRREYYLRTRELKGRKRGTRETSAPLRSTNTSIRTPEQIRAQAHARHQALVKRLEKLKKVLARLVEEAKGNQASGVSEIKVPDKASPSKASGSSSADKKPERRTASEKKKDAKRAKEYRKKNVDPKQKSVEAQIKDVQEKIRKIREQLKDAVDNARNPKPRLKLATPNRRPEAVNKP